MSDKIDPFKIETQCKHGIELFKTKISFRNYVTNLIEEYEVTKDCHDGTFWISNTKNWLRVDSKFINKYRTDKL